MKSGVVAEDQRKNSSSSIMHNPVDLTGICHWFYKDAFQAPTPISLQAAACLGFKDTTAISRRDHRSEKSACFAQRRSIPPSILHISSQKTARNETMNNFYPSLQKTVPIRVDNN